MRTYGRAPLRRAVGAFCVTVLLAVPGQARAVEPAQLRYDTLLDGAITLGGGALWISSELLKGTLAPSTCRWCDAPGVDSSVRDALRTSSTSAADTTSSVLAFAVLPALTFGTDALMAQREGHLSAFPADALVIAESAVIAADVNQLTKFIVGRERPFVHALAPDQKGQTAQPSDNNLSFFSGHTTLAFSLAASAGTVASMRGYRDAPAIWAFGMTMAGLVGYLRIAADKHYFTDVVTGAAVGTGIGMAIPYFFHRPKSDLSVAPMSGGSGVTVSGVF